MKVSNFYDVCDQYDAFIFDLWGTVHDGDQPLPGAIEALEYLKSKGKEICFMSNAPRRKEVIVERLDKMGVDRKLYDFVISSGEDAYLTLKEQASDTVRKIYHMDHTQDIGFYKGLDNYILVDQLSEADVIVNSGVLDAEYRRDGCQSILDEAAKYKLPMLCINPDKVVIYGGKEIVCPGTIAESYGLMGGDVFYHGKPHDAIYQRCLDFFKCKDRSKILALGDALHTDVHGAMNQGIDSIILATGIHAKDFSLDWVRMNIDEEGVKAALFNTIYHPTYILASLLR